MEVGEPAITAELAITGEARSQTLVELTAKQSPRLKDGRGSFAQNSIALQGYWLPIPANQPYNRAVKETH